MLEARVGNKVVKLAQVTAAVEPVLLPIVNGNDILDVPDAVPAVKAVRTIDTLQLTTLPIFV